jgi:hypothetical protein
LTGNIKLRADYAVLLRTVGSLGVRVSSGFRSAPYRVDSLGVKMPADFSESRLRSFERSIRASLGSVGHAMRVEGVASDSS